MFVSLRRSLIEDSVGGCKNSGARAPHETSDDNWSGLGRVEQLYARQQSDYG
jgi:hypothetical protein